MSFPSPAAGPPSVVVPGNHDGVHRGHRALLDAARRRARDNDLRVLALFFDPHPLQVLAPDHAPTPLTMPERRAELLRGLGADDVVIQPFDESFAHLSAEEFVGELLVGRYRARSVVVGPDFHFGHRREGDVERLRELGREAGFDVQTVGPVRHAGGPVSSTRIRETLRRGQVGDAAELLARVHEVHGTVVEGDRRGRTLGFPTANLACEPILLPADGIYAVMARRLDRPDAPRLCGAASLGTRPTFDGAGRSFEVFLFDFDGDLYGAPMRVGFVEWIRAEERFDSVEALTRRMHQDVEQARDFLSAADEGMLSWI